MSITLLISTHPTEGLVHLERDDARQRKSMLVEVRRPESWGLESSGGHNWWGKWGWPLRVLWVFTLKAVGRQRRDFNMRVLTASLEFWLVAS